MAGASFTSKESINFLTLLKDLVPYTCTLVKEKHNLKIFKFKLETWTTKHIGFDFVIILYHKLIRILNLYLEKVFLSPFSFKKEI